MKKPAFPMTITLLTLLTLLLSACNTAQAQDTSAAASSGERQLPQSMRLALGTLALENSDQAITSEQAAALLPLWQAADSLSSADNITPEETQGLFDQIEEAMTTAQLQAIQSMDLTEQSMADLASQYGFQIGGPGGGAGPGNVTEEMRATMQAARESGQMPEGFTPGMAPPDGGGPIPGGEGGMPGGGQGFFRNRSNNSEDSTDNTSVGNPIYQAVIALLEKKIQ